MMNFEQWWAGTDLVPYWMTVEKRQARDIWRAAVEALAKSWDGCEFMTSDGPVDIGQNIRATLTQESLPKASPPPAPPASEIL